MDISATQYNSASESGWTHYLDQSSLSENYFQRTGGIVDYEGKGAEEDLSMISDASSGPAHYDDEFYCENWYPFISTTSQHTKDSQKKKVKEYYGRSQQLSSPLDDTASSPDFSFPKESQKKEAVKNALDFSQCLPATRIKRKPKFQNHLNLFRGKQASEEQGGFDEEEERK